MLTGNCDWLTSTSVAVFAEASVGIEVAGLLVLALNAGAVHGARAGHLVLGITPAAQAGLIQ